MFIHTCSIEEVSSFLNVESKDCIESLLFKEDDRYVLVLVRGDHDVNDIKLKNHFEASVVELADTRTTKEVLGCSVGSIGPVGGNSVEVIADNAVQAVVNGVCGENEEYYHFTNVNPERDFKVLAYTYLRFIKEGNPSPDGLGTIVFAKGIEVGHVFKLGIRYSKAMNARSLMKMEEKSR